jgi:uncharacterized protein
MPPSPPPALPPPPAPDSPAPQVEPPAHPGSADRVPWRAWTAPAAVVLGLGVGILATIVVDIVAHIGGSSLAHPTPAANIIGDIVFDLGFVGAALWFASLGGRPRAADFGFRRFRLATAIKAIVLAVIGYYGLTAVYASFLHLHGSDKLPSELGVTHSTAALVAASIFVCAIAPMAEEFFFRGFFFGGLRNLRIQVLGRDLGPWLAAIVTGILFGLAHTGSASSQYLIPLGFLGFVLCLVRWRTGSLYPCMALHSANNALALGVNQLHWNAAEVIGLILASWLVIAAIMGPLGARSPSLA